jgi:hypothetical protein
VVISWCFAVFFVSDSGYCFSILFDQEKGIIGYSKIEQKLSFGTSLMPFIYLSIIKVNKSVCDLLLMGFQFWLIRIKIVAASFINQ